MKISSRARRWSHGFTLVELMVVIAIIGALAGIAVPSYLGYINKSDRTVCMANLREIYTIGTLYADDHRKMLPCSGMADDPSTPNLDESKGWWVALVPYAVTDENLKPTSKRDSILLPKIFHCKNDERGIGVEKGTMFEATADTVSYASWTDNSSNKANPGSCIQMSRGQILSGLPWLSDGIPQTNRSVRSEADFEEMVMPAMERHGDYIMFVYADGSTKQVENPKFKEVAPTIAGNR